MVQQALSFYLHRFLPPIWVLVVVAPFVSVVVMIRSSRLQFKCRQWHCSFSIWSSPKLLFVKYFSSLSLLPKALHSQIFVLPRTLNWNFYMCQVATSCSQEFFHSGYKNSPLSLSIRGGWMLFLLPSQSIFLYYELNNCGGFKERAQALWLQRPSLHQVYVFPLCDKFVWKIKW